MITQWYSADPPTNSSLLSMVLHITRWIHNNEIKTRALPSRLCQTFLASNNLHETPCRPLIELCAADIDKISISFPPLLDHSTFQESVADNSRRTATWQQVSTVTRWLDTTGVSHTGVAAWRTAVSSNDSALLEINVCSRALFGGSRDVSHLFTD